MSAMASAEAGEIVGDDAQHGASVEPHVHLAQGLAHRILAAPGHALGQLDDEIGQDRATDRYGAPLDNQWCACSS